MNKNRQNISELKDFFKHNDDSRAIKAITTVMKRLVIQAKTVCPVKNPNCKFIFVQEVKLLILFPFYSVKTAAEYAESGLGKLFSCKKDMFYRLIAHSITFCGFQMLKTLILRYFLLQPNSYKHFSTAFNKTN